MSQDSNEPEQLVIFFKPFEEAGTTYDHITLREPTFAEVASLRRNLGMTEFRYGAHDEYHIALVAKVSGLKISVASQIPYKKIEEAVNYLLGFSQDQSTSGDPASPLLAPTMNGIQ